MILVNTPTINNRRLTTADLRRRLAKYTADSPERLNAASSDGALHDRSS
ncbi:MAG: hypothetical protein ACRCUY_06310 [Thermoguttaceae bacterium]